jgi:arsenical pump membrane protein
VCRKRDDFSTGTALLGSAGVAAAIVAAVLAPRAARGAWSVGWPPFALIAGLLLVGAAAGAEGLFAASGRAAARIRGGGTVLLLGSLLLAAVVTAVLNLDTSVVFLTPILIALAREAGLDEQPFLYGSVLMANAGSLFLPGSNLTNLIVLGHGRANGGAFAMQMLPAAVASVLVTAALLCLLFRRSLRRRSRPENPPPTYRPGLGTLAVAAAIVLVLALREPALPVLALGVAVALLHRELSPRRALDVLGPPALVGLLGIVVAFGALARTWTWPAHHLATLGVWASAGVGAAAAVAVDNLPAAALLSGTSPAHPHALLVGLNLGPNLAVTGSLSALLWWRTARAAGARPSVLRYTLLGLATAPAAATAALLALRL